MNQQEPFENNRPITPGSGIQQQVENSTLVGGMQAIQGDNNIQLQEVHRQTFELPQRECATSSGSPLCLSQ